MVDYVSVIGVYVGIYLILAVGMNIALGFGGLFVLAPAAFYGVGAYVTAQVVHHLMLPFPFELVAALLGAGIIGVAASVLVVRLRHDYLIIGTFALQLVASNVFQGWQPATGGNYGIFGISRPVVGGPVTSVSSYALMTGVVAIMVLGFAEGFRRTGVGLVLRAEREDELLANCFGHPPHILRAVTFAITAAVCGLAGGLYAQYIGYIDPTSFDISQTLSIVSITVIGGLGNVWGTLIAALVMVSVPQVLSLIPATSDSVAQVQLLLFGVVMLGIIYLRPRGLLSENRGFSVGRSKGVSPRESSRGLRRVGRKAEAALQSSGPPISMQVDELESGLDDGGVSLESVSVAVEDSTKAAPSLEVRELNKRFGGIKAVDSVSFSLQPGKVTALIGPNGAGKTTILNLISGHLQSDSGEVVFSGQNIAGMQPHDISRLGIVRTFQEVRVFRRLSPAENLAVALLGPGQSSRWGVAHLRDPVARVLKAFGLSDCADVPCEHLSYAQQKVLMMATVVVRGDRLVLLDEVAAGLDPNGIGAFVKLVREMSRCGRTVCLVEHNLRFVWDTADHVIVLNDGKAVAAGTPDSVRSDPYVAEVYFGSQGRRAST